MTERLELSSLRNALESLRESLQDRQDISWLDHPSTSLRKTLTAGIVKNFEFVFELSIKMVRRQLELEATSRTAIDSASFRGLVRLAAESGIISAVEPWFTYRELRNITAHTYDHAKAELVCAASPALLADAWNIYHALVERPAA